MINKLRQTIYTLLKRSEKFFQTDMIYLAKGGFWLTLGQIVSSLSSFLLAIAFANLLPKEVYGTYKYVLSIIGILSVFTLSGMGTSLTRSVARGFEGSLIPILKEKIKWGSIGSLVSLGIAVYYYLNANLTLTICFVIATIFLPLMDSLGIYGSLLNGRKNFKLSTKYNIIIKVIATMLMILVLIFNKNIFLILFTYFISYTSLRFIFLKITIKKEKPNSETELDTISYGKHLSLMNVILTIANNIDKIIIFHYLGAIDLAIYTIAIAPINQIKGVLSNIGIISFPKISQKNKYDLKKYLPIKIFKSIPIILFIVTVYIIIAPTLYKLFFPQYLGSVFYTQIFSLSLLLFPKTLLGLGLLANQKKKYLYYSRISYSLLKILLLYILIQEFGILGCILTLLITNLINFITLFYFFKKI